MGDAERELNSLVSDAVQLRASQDAFFKRVFESLPSCVRRTLFEEKEEEKEARTVDEATKLIGEASVLLKRSHVMDALAGFEKAVGRVYYVELRPKAPHWREAGVRDEYIKVVRKDDIVAARALTGVADCLFLLNQWNECLSTCNFVLQLQLSDKNVVIPVLVLRAKSILKLNKQDAEETALRDLVKGSELDPENTTVKSLLLDVRNSIKAREKKEKQAFGGLFNKKGVRLALDGDDAKQPKALEEEEEEEAKVKTDLDPLELEAARHAGLDANDPAIRELLIRLSTKEGRELFERETQRLEKVQQKDSAYWKVVIT